MEFIIACCCCCSGYMCAREYARFMAAAKGIARVGETYDGGETNGGVPCGGADIEVRRNISATSSGSSSPMASFSDMGSCDIGELYFSAESEESEGEPLLLLADRPALDVGAGGFPTARQSADRLARCPLVLLLASPGICASVKRSKEVREAAFASTGEEEEFSPKAPRPLSDASTFGSLILLRGALLPAAGALGPVVGAGEGPWATTFHLRLVAVLVICFCGGAIPNCDLCV